MTGKLQGELVEAITSFSPKRLQEIINNGADLSHPLFESPYQLPNFDVYEDGEVGKEEMIALGDNSFLYPLHLAIVYLYHSVNRQTVSDAKEILTILIANGSTVVNGCGEIYILNPYGYSFVSWNRDYPQNRPVNLAMFLKKYPWYLQERETAKLLDWAVSALEAAAKLPGLGHLRTTPVMKTVTSTYQNLLFSEDFSDVTFQCSDNVSVPAHKCILAASSPYFKAAFQGGHGWAENNADGIWKTRHSSKLIKSVLRIVYTGSTEEYKTLLRQKDSDPLDLYDLACEYEIKALMALALDKCIKAIKVDNVTVYLQKANMYSNNNGKLKKACFNFIQQHSTKVLMRPEMMGLATEDEELWKELGTHLNGDNKENNKQNKRRKTK